MYLICDRRHGLITKKEMESYCNLQSAIDLRRYDLIIKGEMERYCNLNLAISKGYYSLKDSVNDDLETLFENIGLGREPNESIDTYFLPKLTEEELELVSESDSKYNNGRSYLTTFVIEKSSEKSLKNKCSLQ